jgi:tetratricopeptide (TPR) repeat protein
LVAAATINYNNKNYSQALNHYIELENVAILKNNELEAQIGQMRCHYLLGEMGYAEEYADKVIMNPSTPDGIKNTAFLWRGRIRMQNAQWDEAYYDFVEVEKKGGEKGAESKYNMALIAFKKQAYKPAESEIFKLIEKYSAFNEWKYKGFLLLADVYLGLEDYFQARATLNTIKENVSEPWVIDECQKKLKELDLIENPPTPSNRSSEIEINLGNNPDTPNSPLNEDDNE